LAQAHKLPVVPTTAAKGRIFISKAVIVLSLAKKNRDADHLQNFVYDQCKGINADRLAADLRKAPKYVPIPDYAYDCHTHSPTPVRVQSTVRRARKQIPCRQA
jgi:hypothetical protein